MIAWWKHARGHGDCGAYAGHGPQGEGESGGRGHHGPGHHGPGGRHGHEGWGEHAHAGGEHDGDFGGGSFGVRRPLRFLAYKLELDEKQVAELARVLNELKTERAQAEVDHRRSIAGFADAISAEAFDEKVVGSVATERVKSAERLRDAVVKALSRIHALLSPEQRAKLAYLIRTGALTL
ncbi:MAG: Spy/CpxP family protein refolding chaperone [Byssovorax sp.]